MSTIFSDPEELMSAVGKHLGYSEWLEIDQARIDRFAEATGDHQWIHVDPERASRGPFGKTIAHGYLTMSLASLFLPQLMRVEGCSMGINYGCNKVRFPAPVPVGSRIRGSGEIIEATAIPGGVQVIVLVTVELEGSAKPACIIESIARFLK